MLHQHSWPVMEFDDNPEGKAMLANSITLTPGTITVDTRDDRFLVHCLDKDFGDGLENSAMEKRILNVEKGGGVNA